jgi:hypothetical protein
MAEKRKARIRRAGRSEIGMEFPLRLFLGAQAFDAAAAIINGSFRQHTLSQGVVHRQWQGSAPMMNGPQTDYEKLKK